MSCLYSWYPDSDLAGSCDFQRTGSDLDFQYELGRNLLYQGQTPRKGGHEADCGEFFRFGEQMDH